jgi:Spy/CpxP family protein refolding chaperone
MNKKLIGLMLLLTLPLAVVAAETDSHPNAQKRVEFMTKELGLTSEQQAKVEAIFEAQNQKLKAIHEEGKTSLQAVLTPEQLTKFTALHEKHQQLRKEKVQGNK